MFFTIAAERREHIFLVGRICTDSSSSSFSSSLITAGAFRVYPPPLLHSLKVALTKGSLQKLNSARESDPCFPDPQRPRVHDTYNVCPPVEENKLKKLKVNTLQEIL